MARQDRFLAATDALITRVVGGFPSGVVAPLAALAAGGSRHRSLLLVDLLDDVAAEEAPPAAAAVELLHLATLVHDDVIDGSEQRRHVPALHAATDVATALWAADALYAEAVHLALAVTPSAARSLAFAMRRVAGSQMLEATRPGVDDYWEVVDGKTVALFDLVFELADELSDGALPVATAQAVSAFGRLFQYVDDLHDILGDGADLGKPTGVDARNQIATLPAADLAGSRAAVDARLGQLCGAVLDPVNGGPFADRFAGRVDALVAAVAGR